MLDNATRSLRLVCDARLLGNLIIASVVSAAMARPADVSRPFWLYIDEAYAFINRDIETLLDRCRKRGLHLALAHQRLGQLYERSQAIGDSVVEGGQCKIIFRLVGKSADEMAYQVFGSTFNLEEPKKSLIKPVAVGQEKILLKARSKGRGTNQTLTVGRGKAEGSAVAHNQALTNMESETEMSAEAESYADADSDSYNESRSRNSGSGTGSNYSHTDSLSEIQTGGFFEIRPNDSATIGTADSYGNSANSFSGEGLTNGSAHGHSTMHGGSTMRGTATTRGKSETTGRSETSSRVLQTSHADALGTSENESESEHEALRTIYKLMPGATYSLEELKHRYAMQLANLPERHAVVKVQNLAPIEIIVNTVKPPLANERRVAAFTAVLTQADEYTKPLALIEQELAERPMKLIQEAAEFRHVRELAARRAETDEDFDE
jgi:hypothetical protein